MDSHGVLSNSFPALVIGIKEWYCMRSADDKQKID